MDWVSSSVLLSDCNGEYNKQTKSRGMTAIQKRPGFHWKKKSQRGYLSSLGSRQQEEDLELFSLAFRHQLALGKCCKNTFQFCSGPSSCGCSFSDKIVLEFNWRLMWLVMKNCQQCCQYCTAHWMWLIGISGRLGSTGFCWAYQADVGDSGGI